jgi:hypothetical protein
MWMDEYSSIHADKPTRPAAADLLFLAVSLPYLPETFLRIPLAQQGSYFQPS